ncbi:MAG: right-handed parallel beta-helix repeat-containing protein, partial [Candidatus Hodarchaeales archaeon]
MKLNILIVTLVIFSIILGSTTQIIILNENDSLNNSLTESKFLNEISRNNVKNQERTLDLPNESETKFSRNVISKQYFESSPISIIGNAGFTGFPGNGTLVDPYRIEGLDITSGSGFLVHIEDTDVHFRISNNILNGLWTSDFGILLNNVKNGIIENNTVYNANGGIELENSTNNIINNNNLFDNNWNAIDFYLSNNNTVLNNDIHYNFNGIFIEQSKENNIENNIINNNFVGFRCYDSIYNSFNNNSLSNNDGYAVLTLNSPSNDFENNSLRNNGFNFRGDKVTSLIQNSVFNNSINGKSFLYWINRNGGSIPDNVGQIFLISCSDVIITNKNLSNSSQGITAAYSSNITIFNNTVRNNRWGIFLDHFTNQSKVFNNSLSNNMGDIRLWRAKNNVVHNNIVGSDSDYGIVITDSQNNLIIENVVYNTKISGIWIEKDFVFAYEDEISSNNEIRRNDFLNNGDFEVVDDGVENIFKQNYWGDRTGYGPYTINGSAGSQDFDPIDNPFHVSIPNIVSYPLGFIHQYNQINIEWESSTDSFKHPISYSIFYSIDNGDSWIKLESNIKTTSVAFDADFFLKDIDILLKVQAIDSFGYTSESISDSTFYILTKLTEPTIIFPNGGEIFKEPVTIRWKETFGPNDLPITYSVSYSSDGGATWKFLKEGETAISLFWNTTTLPNGLSYLVKVVAINSEGQDHEDVSDAPFAIENPAPTIKTTVEIPNFTSLVLLLILFG